MKQIIVVLKYVDLMFSHSSLPDRMKLKLISEQKFDFKSEFSYFVHVHHNQKLWANTLI